MRLEGQRNQLASWIEKKGPAGIKQYRSEKISAALIVCPDRSRTLLDPRGARKSPFSRVSLVPHPQTLCACHNLVNSYPRSQKFPKRPVSPGNFIHSEAAALLISDEKANGNRWASPMRRTKPQ